MAFLRGFGRYLPARVVDNRELAPMVGADLVVMERDAARMRKRGPIVFTNLKSGAGLESVVRWIREDVLFLDQ